MAQVTARLLIAARNRIEYPDGHEKHFLTPRRGAIVVVRRPDVEFERLEVPPEFYRVEILNIPFRKLRFLMEPQVQDDDEKDFAYSPALGVIIERPFRLQPWRFRLSAINPAKRAQMEAGETIQLTAGELISGVRRFRDNGEPDFARGRPKKEDKHRPGRFERVR